MKPETLQKIREMAENKFPINKYPMTIFETSGVAIKQAAFMSGAKAVLSTPELLEGEGWRKVVWTLDKPRKDAERVFMAATLVDDQWEMEAFEMRKYSDQHGDEYVLLTSEGEAVPYEELSASMYFEIPLLSPPPSE